MRSLRQSRVTVRRNKTQRVFALSFTVATANFRSVASAERFGEIMATTMIITIQLLILVFIYLDILQNTWYLQKLYD